MHHIVNPNNEKHFLGEILSSKKKKKFNPSKWTGEVVKVSWSIYDGGNGLGNWPEIDQ